MPQPIIPIHQLSNLDSLFNRKSDDYDYLAGSLSTVQQQFLGNEPNQKVAANKYSDKIIDHLEAISKEEEELITVAHSLATSGRSGQVYYRVPSSVSDTELIGLKTQGLVVGGGRVVAFTDRAKVALREKWLQSENKLKSQKTKDGFDHPMKTASQNDKFVRTAERRRKVILPQE